jgi:hypothetical protein
MKCRDKLRHLLLLRVTFFREVTYEVTCVSVLDVRWKMALMDFQCLKVLVVVVHEDIWQLGVCVSHCYSYSVWSCTVGVCNLVCIGYGCMDFVLPLFQQEFDCVAGSSDGPYELVSRTILWVCNRVDMSQTASSDCCLQSWFRGRGPKKRCTRLWSCVRRRMNGRASFGVFVFMVMTWLAVVKSVGVLRRVRLASAVARRASMLPWFIYVAVFTSGCSDDFRYVSLSFLACCGYRRVWIGSDSSLGSRKLHFVFLL